MHRFIFLLLFLGCVLGVRARDPAPEGLYDGYTGFALPAGPVLPAHETHPSLWFKAADLATVKARLTGDDFARTRWIAVQAMADLTQAVPVAPTAKDKTTTIHQYYGAMSIAARAHAFVALFTDDPATAAAHRRRATELLLRAYDGPIFDLDARIKGSPVDEIYRGSWLQNYAHAYDCLQTTLDPATDRLIRDRLAREAQCVYENLFVWTPDSPHNHLSKPAWGLGTIALTLADDPRASDWLGRALEAANKNTRYFFSGDGLYREGSHYLIFSLTNFVPFLYHYRNVAGVDGFAPFQPVFEAMVAVRNSHGWLPNLEDSYLRPTPTHLVAAAYGGTKSWLHSTAPLAEILTWSYQTCDLAPFERERAESGFNYTGASWDYPLELDELLTHDATLRATAPDPDPNVFLAGGQTVFRNAWVAADAGQRYLLFHGMAVADNHNHDDQLSFILEAGGQLMCSDAGYSRGTYAGAERTTWYSTASAHNTLTFDGRPAGRTPSNLTPPGTFRVGQPGLIGEEKSVRFDPQADWRRAIFWIAGDYYAVIDRVTASRPGKLQARLHGGRGTLTADGPHRTWHYEADRYGPAAELHVWTAAPGATTTVQPGELTYIKGDYAEFPYLETTATTGSAAWLTLLKPAQPGGGAGFTVRELRDAGHTILHVTTPTETTLIAAGAGGPLTVDDIETDASLVIVRRDAAGRLLNHFTRDASYLRVAGQTLPLE